MTALSLSLNRISVSLGGQRVLDDVSLDLPEKRIIGLIGPSGSGKTTLIRTIVGRQKAEGSVQVLGLPAGAPELRKQVSYMTQEVAVYTDLTVIENLEYFCTMAGISRQHRTSEIVRLIKLVDLEPQSGQIVGTLSGGQKQRVSLAIALIGRPELLVLDEPTVGLDPILRVKLWQLFRKLASDGATVIVSSHVMDEAAHCDDLVLLRDGKVLAHDTPAALCAQTKSKTVEESFLKLVGQAS